MRTMFWQILCIAGMATTLAADEGLSPQILTAVKRATVFVEVEVEGQSASGSGFVVTVEENSALVVTNHHVVEPRIIAQARQDPKFVPVARLRPSITRPRPPSSTHLRPPITRYVPSQPIVRPLPPDFTPRSVIRTLKNAVVTVVFDSGTKNERSARAELLALDPDYDLAVMRVKDVKDLPEPIKIETAAELVETMTVYTFGFPFGKVLATGDKRPAITVSKAAVSSLRENDDGDLAVVQIDGSLNPGNSGGPIVSSRGELVGVAVATIRNSSGIGLAIPAGPLNNMLDGRIGEIHLTSKPDGAKPAVAIEVAVIDPLKKIASVALHYADASRALADPEKEIESLEALAGSKKTKLTLEKQLAQGEFALSSAGEKKEFLVQAVYSTADGETRKTRVFRQSLQQVAVAAATPDPSPAPKEAGKGAAGSGAGLNGEFRAADNPKDAGKGTAGNRSAPADAGAGGETRILGGAFSPTFKDQAPETGLLIGFEIGLGQFANLDVVKAIRPIYRTDKKQALGKQHGTKPRKVIKVKAKDGYAVGSITVRSGLLVNGFSVTFMRVKDGKLDPDDAYESDWIGDRTGGSETTLKGNGTPVTGIVGKASNTECLGLGLVFDTKP